jgi:hypothetical protein
MGLRENLEIIYELQSVTGKILKRQGFRVSRFQGFKDLAAFAFGFAAHWTSLRE